VAQHTNCCRRNGDVILMRLCNARFLINGKIVRTATGEKVLISPLNINHVCNEEMPKPSLVQDARTETWLSCPPFY
jgi:hypothetical protein